MSALNEQHIADRRVTEWFRREKARKEAVAARPDPAACPVITLSRQYGAGGNTVAHRLVELLGPPWEVWNRELIEAVADKAQVRTEMVEALDERAQSWMDEMIRRAFGRDVLEPATYRKNLAQILLALAQQGHKIIVGRGANFVLHHALNVRLQATEAHRVQATMQRMRQTEEEARRHVQQVDRARDEFTSNIFSRQIDDPAAYDMVLETDSLGLEPAAAAIVAAARAKFRLPEPR